MCEPSLRGEEVIGDGDGDGEVDQVISFGIGEDEGDNVLSLTDVEGSILSSRTDVEEDKIDESSSGQFPLTIVVE